MKKRRLFSFLLLLVLLAGMFSVPAFADGEEADDTGPFEVHAKAAILLDMNTDRIITKKSRRARLPGEPDEDHDLSGGAGKRQPV